MAKKELEHEKTRKWKHSFFRFSVDFVKVEIFEIITTLLDTL